MQHTAIARRRWAHRMIRRAAYPPPYGSPEWLALPEGDVAKVAGVVVAAECWAQAGATLDDDLRREVEATREEHKLAEDAEYQQRAAAHQVEWSGLADVVPFSERRRRQLKDAEPRPGDRAGSSRPRGGEAS